MIETNRIEFKEKFNDNFLKEAVAFLNYVGGGVIYLGIDKNGNIVGVEDIDKVQLLIKDQLRNNIVPSCLGLFDIVTEKREKKNILKVILASGLERPYYIKNMDFLKKVHL